MIKYSAINHLHRIYNATNSMNLEYRDIAIPKEFESQADEMFDPIEMQRLFELGYRMGLSGTGWKDSPPEYLLGRRSKVGKKKWNYQHRRGPEAARGYRMGKS